MPPDISVIIPTYNRADYVEQCLGSLGASGADDLEAILVDDGSTDETRSRFASDARCRYIHQRNQGPAAARNLGVDHARGRYLAFLDCDDRWLPGVASRVVGLLDRHFEVDVVFTEALVGNDRDGYQSWIEAAGQAAFYELPHRDPEPGFRVLEAVPFFRRMAVRNAVFIGALVMRREAFERSGRFEQALCGAADWELWLRMASRMTFGYWPEPLAIYTRHDDNMSSHHDRMKVEFCQALENVLRKCPHLAPGERAWVRARLRDQAFGLAYDAYDRGEFDLARSRFASHILGHGPAPKTALYWALSGLPGGMPRLVRRLKRALIP
jgi:glycosyltransferase involved in cell wall biosynthesis